MNYRLEYREGGRRHWRVVWHGFNMSLGDYCNTYRTFRSRERAEAFIAKRMKRRADMTWVKVPPKPEPRLPSPARGS